MVLFQNLSYILKVLNLKGTEFVSDNVLRLKFNKKIFLWNKFFDFIYKTNKFSTLHPFYLSKALNDNNVFEDFCRENNIQIIIHGKTIYNDYEIAGFKFKDNKQKTLFILKFGEILQQCIK